jgi:hypothetical protein
MYIIHGFVVQGVRTPQQSTTLYVRNFEFIVHLTFSQIPTQVVVHNINAVGVLFCKI